MIDKEATPATIMEYLWSNPGSLNSEAIISTVTLVALDMEPTRPCFHGWVVWSLPFYQNGKVSVCQYGKFLFKSLEITMANTFFKVRKLSKLNGIRNIFLYLNKLYYERFNKSETEHSLFIMQVHLYI